MKRNILNHKYIEQEITTNDKKTDVRYRWSHGATDKHMGDGIIVYSMMYFFKPKLSVCLGSGGGFIPRIMSKCLNDLNQEGFNTDESRVILVDAVNGVNGHPDWIDDDSFYRNTFQSEWLHTTTEKAYYEYFIKRDMKIDVLWIDADHSLEGVKKDFDLYSEIMSENGIIMVHDTDKNYVDNFLEIKDHEGDDLSGPSEFVKTIDKRKFEVMSFSNYKEKSEYPTSSGITIVRKK